MRGAFIAVFGADPVAGQFERAIAALRWHRGDAEHHVAGPLQVAVLADPVGGPAVETNGERTLVVHGEPPRPLAELQRDGRRFAALDCSSTMLAAARDPLGLAPLFYRALHSAIWFSTEILPLVALEPAAPDLDALAAQATLVPDDARTGFTGVLRVLPGFVLEVAEDLTLRQRCYWRVERLFASFRGDREQAEDELRVRFVEAVDRALAPGAAILLSGGIDSTAVTAAASRIDREFSLLHVAFPELGDATEEEHAQRISTALGRPLEVISGEVGPWDPEEDLRTSVVPYLTPPSYTADTALGHLAKHGVTVALDGNDGDGVLGYAGREWGELLRTGDLRRLGELARTSGRRRVVRGLVDDVVPPAVRLRKLRGRPEPGPTYLQTTERYFDETMHHGMRAIDYQRWQNPFGAWRARQLRQVLPVTTARNEEHELRGARFGIEMRHPFADRDLVEFLISLPAGIKSDPGVSKDLLRRALASVAPAGTLERRDKPEYRDVLAKRVDAARCLEWIRGTGVQLPFVDYERLYRDAEDSESVPLGLLISLARAHVFAATYA